MIVACKPRLCSLPFRCKLLRYYTNGTPRDDIRKNVQEELKKLRNAQKNATKPHKPPQQALKPQLPLKPQEIYTPELDPPKTRFPWWAKHVGIFSAFAAISFGLSVYSIEADDPLYYIRKLSDRLAPLKGGNTEKITAILHDLAKYSQTNDLLRRKIVQDGHLNDLITIVEDGATVEIKNLASRIIGNVCLERSNKERVLNSGELKRIADILKDDRKHQDMPLYSRKALAMAIAHCASEEHLRVKLAVSGAPEVLVHVQENDQLKRQAFDRAIAHIASTVIPLVDSGSTGIAVSHKDMTILRNAFEKERSKGTLGQVQNTLVDNGMTMYLHTSLGGAVWGACEALRNKGNLGQIVKASARTALITGLVPIYFVGLGVSLYNHYQRQVNNSEQRFYLTLATTMSLYPWVYLLPIVEKFSPYWLGGHVLGFTSFFVWLLISKNDLLKSDTLLASEDEIQAKRRIK